VKLVFAVTQLDDGPTLSDALVNRGFRVTRINTAGGFLRQGNSTFLLGIDDNAVDLVLGIIRSNCRTRLEYYNPITAGMEVGELAILSPVEVQVGGATVWILDIEEFVRL
jgi:uncharacterized protein YaaQ